MEWRRKRRAGAVGAAAVAAIGEEEGSGERELFGGGLVGVAAGQ